MEFATACLSILIADLVLGVVLLVAGGVAALCRFSFRKFWKYAWWLLLVPPAAMCYGIVVERNCFKVNEVAISDENIPESFDGYRIVQISDIHLRSFENRHKALQRAVDKIMAQNPDLIVFTGDIISLSVDETQGCMEILSGLHAPDGVFSVMGNHDYLTHSRELTEAEKLPEIARLREIENNAGWKMLENERVDIYRPDSSYISVIGIENLSASPQFPSYGNLDAALSPAPFKILLSHDPSAWEAFIVGKTDIDLTLSGHTHDMQLALPGFSPSSLFYKQHKGLYEENGQYLYVNIGLGETIFPARIGARPEITVLVLKS